MGDSISDSWGDDSSKNSTYAQPEEITPDAPTVDENTEVVSPLSDDAQPEGVQTGGFTYTENADGTRNYEGQELVETTGDPTPTPEVTDVI